MACEMAIRVAHGDFLFSLRELWNKYINIDMARRHRIRVALYGLALYSIPKAGPKKTRSKKRKSPDLSAANDKRARFHLLPGIKS